MGRHRNKLETLHGDEVSQSKNCLGDIIYRARQEQDLTQDEYGSRYSVSGPAIFKFEKGYVRPSLELWLAMARDAGINERRSVLLWLKSKLPKGYQDYVELQSAVAHEPKGKKKGQVDFAKCEDRASLRTAAAGEKELPKGMRDLLDDDELWSLYKPTGHELNMLRDMFGPLGRGNRVLYREALRLIREFTHTF